MHMRVFFTCFYVVRLIVLYMCLYKCFSCECKSVLSVHECNSIIHECAMVLFECVRGKVCVCER